MYFDIESTFAECNEGDCPYYIRIAGADTEAFSELCAKVEAETKDVTSQILPYITGDMGDDGK